MATYFTDVIEAVKLRMRSDCDENLLASAPNDDEIASALYDALDEINSQMPETHYTMDQVLSMSDTRWKLLMIFGAVRNTLNIILQEWTHQGIPATIGELNYPDLYDKYNAMSQKWTTEFEQRIEKLKTASQRYVKGCRATGTGENILYPATSYTSIFASRVRIR